MNKKIQMIRNAAKAPPWEGETPTERHIRFAAVSAVHEAYCPLYRDSLKTHGAFVDDRDRCTERHLE
jgi:hypothetical protein